jgi:hypothetical protein
MGRPGRALAIAGVERVYSKLGCTHTAPAPTPYPDRLTARPPPAYRTNAPATNASNASVPATDPTIFCRCRSSSK